MKNLNIKSKWNFPLSCFYKKFKYKGSKYKELFKL